MRDVVEPIATLVFAVFEELLVRDGDWSWSRLLRRFDRKFRHVEAVYRSDVISIEEKRGQGQSAREGERFGNENEAGGRVSGTVR